MVTTFKRLRNIAVGTALVLSSAGAFAAAAPFTVNPNADGLGNGSGSTFVADALNGSSSASIQYTGLVNGVYTYTGTGYIQYTAFTLNGQAIDNDVSTVGSKTRGYGLYATFTQTFSCSTMLSAGTSCTITSINLNLYADNGSDNTYNQATLSSTASVSTVGTQTLLGTTTLVNSGSAGIDAQGGAFQNVNTNFVLTADGSAFFINPTPFYTFAFSAFNNTSQGLTCSPNCANPTLVVINQESGVTDFNAVPEPMPLALMGLGMLGMVAFRRKQAKK